MCSIVYYKDKELETVKEFLSELNLKSFQIQTAYGYKNLDLDSCLCQVNLKMTLQNNHFKFIETGLGCKILS